MKKIILLLALPIFLLTTLSAQITQEEADVVVKEHMSSETAPFTIYAKDYLQIDGFTVATTTGEVLKFDYSCWVYYVKYIGATNGKYLIVKESNGNKLEVNNKNDEGPNNINEWKIIPFLQYSVWECSTYQNWYGQVYYLDPPVVFSFYPSISKLIIGVKSTKSFFCSYDNYNDDMAGIYGYFIDDGVLHLIPDRMMFWRITYFFEDELILSLGKANPSKFYFICQTEFKEI